MKEFSGNDIERCHAEHFADPKETWCIFCMFGRDEDKDGSERISFTKRRAYEAKIFNQYTRFCHVFLASIYIGHLIPICFIVYFIYSTEINLVIYLVWFGICLAFCLLEVFFLTRFSDQFWKGLPKSVYSYPKEPTWLEKINPIYILRQLGEYCLGDGSWKITLTTQIISGAFERIARLNDMFFIVTTFHENSGTKIPTLISYSIFKVLMTSFLVLQTQRAFSDHRNGLLYFFDEQGYDSLPIELLCLAVPSSFQALRLWVFDLRIGKVWNCGHVIATFTAVFEFAYDISMAAFKLAFAFEKKKRGFYMVFNFATSLALSIFALYSVISRYGVLFYYRIKLDIFNKMGSKDSIDKTIKELKLLYEQACENRMKLRLKEHITCTKCC